VDRPFEEMTPTERITYVQELWDRIAAHPEEVPVTAAQRAELGRRKAAHRADPAESIPWEIARERMRRRG
jgi:putative addiction module component (TIGR02574 family)